MNRLALSAAGIAIALAFGDFASAAPPPAQPAPAATQEAATQSAPPLTVAILDFDAGTATAGGTGDLGKQATEAIAALLTGTKGIKLVDRASMAKLLAEHSLNLTGMVDSDNAVKIGKLVGAKILVTGKIFTLGKSTYVTAKIIGTETSLVEGVLVKGEENEDVGTLVASLADKLGKQLVTSGPKLIAAEDGPDGKLEALKSKLAKLAKPTVIVNITEEHHGMVTQPIDPAVETEMRSLLQDCGFTVVDADHAAGSAATYKITGEAFSEYAARVGNLVSCAGRAEINITTIPDGKVVLTTRTTQRGVDLAERIAGKNALQKAGHVTGLEVLDYFAKNLPPAPAPKK
jgi:hypothetical protein